MSVVVGAPGRHVPGAGPSSPDERPPGVSGALCLRRAAVLGDDPLAGDPGSARTCAIAVVRGRVAAIGTEAEARAAAGPDALVIDCEGATVVPGFIDAHVHLLALARSFVDVDVSRDRVDSIDALRGAIAVRRQEEPHAAWVRAYGYDEFYLRERRHPTRFDLDVAVSDRPVRVRHRTRHASVLNSAGLAWVAERAPEMLRAPGVERGADGEPTGVLYDLDAVLTRLLPAECAADLRGGLRRASARFLRAGVIAVDDASPGTGTAEASLLRAAVADGLIQQHVRLLWGIRQHGLPTDPLVTGVKLMVGEGGGPDPDFLEALDAAHRAGLQVAVHAVEGGAIAVALEAFESVLRRWPRPHRHRLEHCALCPPPLVERIAALGLSVVAQPGLLRHVGDRYAVEVPSEQQAWLQPLRSLVGHGVCVAGSSDAPVGPVEPLIGIGAAVHRRARNGTPLAPGESLPLAAALGLYTKGAARVSLAEPAAGTVAVGAPAELLLLSDALGSAPVDRIEDLRVRLVVSGGRCVAVDSGGESGLGSALGSDGEGEIRAIA